MILQMSTTRPNLLLEELTRCSGAVAAILPDGTRQDAITAVASMDAGTAASTRLRLQIRQSGDYMRLACFAIGDI